MEQQSNMAEKEVKNPGQKKKILHSFLEKLRGARNKKDVEELWRQMMADKMFVIEPCLEAMHRVEKGQDAGGRSLQLERQQLVQQQAQQSGKPTLADLLAGLKTQ